MKYVSMLAVPVLIGFFITAGIIKRVNIYDCFIEGAKDGLQSIAGIIPALVGLMMAIYMLRAAGVVEMLTEVLSPLLERAGMTAEVLPLALLRPVSGSASIAIVSDIFKQLGPDSASGRIASVMMGSTETTFYVIAVYFGAAGIKNTRHAVPAALVADFTGIVMAVAVTRLFFNC